MKSYHGSDRKHDGSVLRVIIHGDASTKENENIYSLFIAVSRIVCDTQCTCKVGMELLTNLHIMFPHTINYIF